MIKAFVLVGLLVTAAPPLASGQFPKSFKDGLKKITDKVTGSVRCVVGDRQCLDKAQEKGAKVTIVDSQGNVIASADQPSTPLAAEPGVLTLAAGNARLRPIALPSYGGVPRIGVQDLKGLGTKVESSLPTGALTALRARERELLENGWRHFTMLQMKHTGAYDAVPAQYLSIAKTKEALQHPSGGTPPDTMLEAKLYAQMQLYKVAGALVTSEAYPTYFCRKNASASDCALRPGAPGYPFGGLGADEFETRDAYQRFITDNMDALRKMSAQVSDAAALVLPARVGEYDFAKQVFPLDDGGIYALRSSMKLGDVGPRHVPVTDWERRAFSEHGGWGKDVYGKVQIAVKPADAKAKLERSDRMVYAVYRVQFDPSRGKPKPGPGEGYDRFAVNFHVSSPRVEFYEDQALTMRLGELQLDQMK